MLNGSRVLGVNIKKLRIKKEMSQNDLAGFCRVTQAYISLLEDGKKKNPTSNVLNNIATALGVNINDLFAASASPTDEEE